MTKRKRYYSGKRIKKLSKKEMIARNLRLIEMHFLIPEDAGLVKQYLKETRNLLNILPEKY
jgi:hypothetical protein